MSVKIVARCKNPSGGCRWIYFLSCVPALGIVHLFSRWISQDVDKGLVTTYHVNGRLVARTATYQGV